MLSQRTVMILGGLVFPFFVGCATFGGGDDLTEAQAERLADKILENTPEHTHFVEGTTFSWVLLAPEVQSNPSPLQDVVLQKLRKKYTVYLDLSGVPEDLQFKDENGQVRGYKGGFAFCYQVERKSWRSVRVNYSDYEGELAASVHWKQYKWKRKDWKIVAKSGMLVS